MSYTHTDIHTHTCNIPLISPCIILGPTPITQIKSLALPGVAPTCLARKTREADQDQETPQQPPYGQSLPPVLQESGFTLLEKMSLAESSAIRSPRFFASRPALLHPPWIYIQGSGSICATT